MRRPAVIGATAALSLGAGTAIAVLPGGASAIRTAAHNPARAGTTSGHRATRPPTPRVSTLGVTRSATLVSYCWTQNFPGGVSHGACADGIPGHPTHTLLWEPGAQIRADLGVAAHDVNVQAARFGAAGGRPSHIIHIRITGMDAGGRRWTFRLPTRAKRDTDLLISGQFANGDVEADLGIRRPDRR
jgi:hypothetical protein